MGLFLSMAGVIGQSEEAILETLRGFATAHGGELIPDQRSPEDGDILVSVGSNGRNSILFPYEFMAWDDACIEVSRKLKCPVFSFHIHDGDFWMFHLYADGEVITGFNPIPDYWGDLDDNERQMVRGDAVKVAQLVPGLAPSSIERYFTTWDLEEDPPRKAYADDEFHYGEDWQLVDFLKRLGFQYPLDSVGHPLGQTFRLSVNQK